MSRVWAWHGLHHAWVQLRIKTGSFSLWLRHFYPPFKSRHSHTGNAFKLHSSDTLLSGERREGGGGGERYEGCGGERQPFPSVNWFMLSRVFLRERVGERASERASGAKQEQDWLSGLRRAGKSRQAEKKTLLPSFSPSLFLSRWTAQKLPYTENDKYWSANFTFTFRCAALERKAPVNDCQ